MKFCNIANLYIVPLLTCWTLYREVHTEVLTGDQISLTVDVNFLIGPWEIKKKKKIIHVYLIPRLSVTATLEKWNISATLKDFGFKSTCRIRFKSIGTFRPSALDLSIYIETTYFLGKQLDGIFS